MRINRCRILIPHMLDLLFNNKKHKLCQFPLYVKSMLTPYQVHTWSNQEKLHNITNWAELFKNN